MTARIPLSALDASFLLAETRNTPLHVAGLQIFQIPADAPAHFVSKLFAEMRSHPVSAHPMNYRLRGGLAGKLMPSWEVIDDADLEYHVRRSALPYPGGERELGELVSRLHSNPMDLTKPLW
jgi:diacylglycerol O-acyltransferase / wax synthase